MEDVNLEIIAKENTENSKANAETETAPDGNDKSSSEIKETELTLEEKDKAAHWKRRSASFLTGQAFSMFGSMIVQHAIIFYLTLTYKSGVIMMLAMLCGFLPQIIVSLFSGVIADRVNRKNLIIIADGVIAAATLALAILFLSGFQYVWLLFLVMGIRSAGTGFQMPAVNAFIPQIVPSDKLLKVNGFVNAIQSAVMIVSPVLAAAILGAMTIEIIFFIDVVTAIIAIVILMPLKASKYSRSGEKVGYFDDLKQGVKFVFKDKPLRTFLFFWTLFMFLLTPAMFLPPVHIARAFGEETWRLSLSEVGFATGALLCGILLSAWGGFKSRFKTLFFGCILFGASTFAMGLGGNTFGLIFGTEYSGELFYILFVVFMFISGMSMPFVNIPSTTLIQQYVEPQMLGRVFGLLQIVSASAVPLGSLLSGPLADVINIEFIFIGSGILMMIALLAMKFNKYARLIEKKD